MASLAPKQYGVKVTGQILSNRNNTNLDGDGVSNLMEYTLGTDPRNPTDGLNGMQMSLTNMSGSQYLTLSFKRRKTSSILLQYIPESSDGPRSLKQFRPPARD